jgi:hypothetical protein
MTGELQPGMQCVEVEALLAEALDGTLQGTKLVSFETHQRDCASCRSMVEEARAGMYWLKGLDEAEPPQHLVHNILAQTIGALPSEYATPAPPRGEGWVDRLKARLAPIFAPVATPRFAMSFGMAFFSITMLLGIAGFHMSDLRHWDLSSKGIMKTYYATEARCIRYYENMRLVYEIESKVHDFKRAASPANSSQQPQQPQQEAPATSPKNSPKSELRRDVKPQTPNSSQEHGQPKLAASPAVVPVANPQARRQGSHPVNSMGTLNRRLV